MLPGKKNRSLSPLNCWKCIEIVNPTTTTLFFYHFKSFTIQSGRPFWLLGGGCVCTPHALPLPTGLGAHSILSKVIILLYIYVSGFKWIKFLEKGKKFPKNINRKTRGKKSRKEKNVVNKNLRQPQLLLVNNVLSRKHSLSSRSK